jgi:hypothetical protein
VCRIAKILKDEEIALLVAQSDSDIPSETDDSFELSLKSDSSVLEQTPQVWHSSSHESDKSDSESTSDGEGSGWQAVTDGSHIQAQTTSQYNGMHGLKHAPAQAATPTTTPPPPPPPHPPTPST